MLEEMRLHLEVLRDDFIRDGMTPEAAGHAARKRFGGLAQLEERCRDEHGFIWVGQMGKDFRFTLRSLAQAKLHVFAVILSLVLGVGALVIVTTFTLWKMGQSQGFPAADRVFLVGSGDHHRLSDLVRWGVDFAELQAHHANLADFVATERVPATIQANSGPPQAMTNRISFGCFEFFGIHPRFGRNLEAADYQPGAPPVVVISDVAWRQHFAMDPQVLGRTLRINGQDCRIVGVLNSGYPIPVFVSVDYYLPLAAPADPAHPFATEVIIAARLHHAVTRDQADAELAQAEPPGLDDNARCFFASHHPALLPFERIVQSKTNGYVLAGGVLLYLIACLNGINLGLVRLLGRRQEMALRLALGGSRWQVLRLLLLEYSLLGTVAGGLLALLLSHGVNRIVFALTGDFNTLNLSYLWSTNVGCLVAGIGLAVLAVTIVSGLRLRNLPLGAALKEGDTAGGESRQMKRRRNALVIGQAALAVVLMTVTGLMGLSIVRLLHTDFGYDTANRLKVWLIFPPGHPADPSDRRPYFETLRASLAGRPEIAATSIGQDAMFPGVCRTTTPLLQADGSVLLAASCSADRNLGDAMGLRLRRGRWLTNRPGEQETVLTENLATELFHDADPLGREVRLGAHGETRLTVVGVVGDVRDELRQPPGRRLYLPLWMDTTRINTMVLHLAGPMRPGFDYEVFNTIQTADPQVIVANVSPIEELLQPAIQLELFVARMLCGFACIGYLMALVALFATTAYTVESRMHEYGIRQALGAAPSAIRWRILRRGMTLVLGGVGFGLLPAAGLAWVMRDLLYETSPLDPLVCGLVALLLTAAGGVACLRPAWRAGRSDPAALLKTE